MNAARAIAHDVGDARPASAMVVRPRRVGEVADEGVDGVVAVELGLLEGQQVGLFDEHLDAAA